MPEFSAISENLSDKIIYSSTRPFNIPLNVLVTTSIWTWP